MQERVPVVEYRIETVMDLESGLIYAELYYPVDAPEPVSQTEPLYSSHEQAEREVLRRFEKVLTSGGSR